MSTGQVIELAGRKRPLSVWILTIANGVLAMCMIGASIMSEDKGYMAWQAAIAGIAGLGVSLSAHATWFGNRKGRAALLGLITLFLGLLILQNLVTLAWALDRDYRESYVPGALARVLSSAAWLVLNYWLLLGRRARAFFA